MMLEIVSAVESSVPWFKKLGMAISLVLIILAGIVYGIAQTMPSETRGKWVNIAIGLLIGGLVSAAIIAGAEFIQGLGTQALPSAPGGAAVPPAS